MKDFTRKFGFVAAWLAMFMTAFTLVSCGGDDGGYEKNLSLYVYCGKFRKLFRICKRFSRNQNEYLTTPTTRWLMIRWDPLEASPCESRALMSP